MGILLDDLRQAGPGPVLWLAADAATMWRDHDAAVTVKQVGAASIASLGIADLPSR